MINQCYGNIHSRTDNLKNLHEKKTEKVKISMCYLLIFNLKINFVWKPLKYKRQGLNCFLNYLTN